MAWAWRERGLENHGSQTSTFHVMRCEEGDGSESGTHTRPAVTLGPLLRAYRRTVDALEGGRGPVINIQHPARRES